MQPCDSKIESWKRFQVYKSMFHDRDFWKEQKNHDRDLCCQRSGFVTWLRMEAT